MFAVFGLNHFGGRLDHPGQRSDNVLTLLGLRRCGHSGVRRVSRPPVSYRLFLSLQLSDGLSQAVDLRLLLVQGVDEDDT